MRCVCAVGRALGGETTGLGQLDNIEGFFFFSHKKSKKTQDRHGEIPA